MIQTQPIWDIYAFKSVFAYFLYFVVAVCLDGSLPGYHLQKGFGSGSDNWILHVEVKTTLVLQFLCLWLCFRNW